MPDEEYPSFLTALRSDAAVNLYCATKWAVWQFLHLLLLIFGIAILVILTPLYLAYRGLKYVGNRTADAISRRTPTVNTGATRKVASATQAVPRTGVGRRIYGHCPVDIHDEPRWFERLQSVGMSIVEWAEPPDDVWLCTNCGEIHEGIPLSCDHCYSPDEFESMHPKVADDRAPDLRAEYDPEEDEYERVAWGG